MITRKGVVFDKRTAHKSGICFECGSRYNKGDKVYMPVKKSGLKRNIRLCADCGSAYYGL